MLNFFYWDDVFGFYDVNVYQLIAFGFLLLKLNFNKGASSLEKL